MGRWEPDARGRLAEAALALFTERGYEATTTAEIAARAGLTERTFFRHFAHKREVLFHGAQEVQALMARAVIEAPPEARPTEAIGAALTAFAATVAGDADRVRLRAAVIGANAELRERELVKLQASAALLARSLRERGADEPGASLAAEAGIAVMKIGFARWIAAPEGPGLATLLREASEALRAELA